MKKKKSSMNFTFTVLPTGDAKLSEIYSQITEKVMQPEDLEWLRVAYTAKARTREALEKALKKALPLITANDDAG